MSKVLLRRLCVACVLACVGCYWGCSSASAQSVAAKSNLIHWGVYGSPNVSVEFRIAPRWTVDLYAGGNLWKQPSDKVAKYIMAQPEVRYWTCEAFNGFFVGFHTHAIKFNLGGLNIPIGRIEVLKDERYEGCLYGAGFSMGYSWLLTPRLNIELSAGGGYAYIDYRAYPCASCGTLIRKDHYNYWGVTRASLSLVYFFK